MTVIPSKDVQYSLVIIICAVRGLCCLIPCLSLPLFVSLVFLSALLCEGSNASVALYCIICDCIVLLPLSSCFCLLFLVFCIRDCTLCIVLRYCTLCIVLRDFTLCIVLRDFTLCIVLRDFTLCIVLRDSTLCIKGFHSFY